MNRSSPTRCRRVRTKVKTHASWLLATLAIVFFFGLFLSETSEAQIQVPKIGLEFTESDAPEDLIPAIKIVGLLTILSVAPAILLMMTAFTRILVILSFVRQALGTMTMPPNQVILGLALFITIFTMAPVWEEIDKKAYTPYVEKRISQEQAIDELIKPIHKFMLAQTRETDLALFYNISKKPKPAQASEVEMSVLMPAFMVSELMTAFQIGFMVYIPFLIIDMVISSILMAMGMLMLPPTVVSLPFKLVLFVLVDGWNLIVENIVKSFNF